MRLYDRASAVFAELVANSYDADAQKVTVSAPMGNFLAKKVKDRVEDLGLEIVVADNGHGMTPEEVKKHYLIVGLERRKDVHRGERSRELKRRVMGRKGVGKLAPFGICGEIEVISSGGQLIERAGNKGYLTAHLVLKRDDMLFDQDDDYAPEVGSLDETLQPVRGTTIKLRKFAHRSVPELADLARQMAQRFGVNDPKWNLDLFDTSTNKRVRVGIFDVETMEDTKITFVGPSGVDDYTLPTDDVSKFRIEGPLGVDVSELRPYVKVDDLYYPIRGWIAYAKSHVKNDLEAGVRIYCQRKIAAQTLVFNRGAGFHGEHNVRSYLVGELHIDWLDAEQDLIQTDRRDILWSDELGQALQSWGENTIKVMTRIARNPMRVKTWDRFVEASDLRERLEREFPKDENRDVRDRAEEVIKLMAQTMRENEMQPDDVESVVKMGILLAPIMELDETLRSAASDEEQPIGVMAQILHRAKIAELTSFGLMARQRVRIIETIQKLTEVESPEQDLQNLIDSAPWLINPEWSPVTSNRTLASLKKKFEIWLKKNAGKVVELKDFTTPGKRPDYVLTTQHKKIEIVEIKKPHYDFGDADFKRMSAYHREFDKFLNASGNEEIKSEFGSHHITLVCDGIALEPDLQMAFDHMVQTSVLEHLTWAAFLRKTERVHKQFLDVAERETRKIVQLDEARDQRKDKKVGARP